MIDRKLSIKSQLDTGYLIFSSLTYLLGAGVARYMGTSISIPSLIVGWFTIFIIIIGFTLLTLFFSGRKYLYRNVNSLGEKAYAFHLWGGMSFLALACLIIIFLLIDQKLNLLSAILIFMVTGFMLIYSLQFRMLAKTGYNEFVPGMVSGFLIPLFAYFLQEIYFYPIILIITIPLILWGIASTLSMNLILFGKESNIKGQLLIEVIPPRTVLFIHNILILSSYLLFLIMPLFGVSWKLVWPVFMSVPFSILEILLMNRVGIGSMPIVSGIKIFISLMFSLPIYFLLISFWLR